MMDAVIQAPDQAEPVVTAPSPSADEQGRRRWTLLCVDDEPNILSALLLRGNHRQDDEVRLRNLQEALEKGIARLERELRRDSGN